MQSKLKFFSMLVIFIGVMCIASTAFGAKEMFLNKISEVKLSGGRAPIEGEKPSYSWGVHTFDEKKYAIKSYYWNDYKNNKKMDPNDTFKSGCRYDLVTIFEAVGEYYFDDEKNITAGFYNSFDGYTTLVRKNPTGIVVTYSFVLPYNVYFNTDGGTQIPSQKVFSRTSSFKTSKSCKTRLHI